MAAASALAALAGTASTAPPQKKAAVAVAATRTPTPAPASPASWREVDRLVSEQKFEEASRQVDALLQSAKARRDSTDWTKALIRSVQLRTGLHGYETAVRFLKDEPWPPDLLSRTALQLFYAQSLVNYAQMYSWEISRRERVESTGAVDLKAWTREQIYDEAARVYVALWKEREALGGEKVQALSDFVQPNDYPPGIRDTLRDAVGYFFAALLADSSGWSPAQSNAVFTLDLPELLRADAKTTAAVRLDDPATHPLTRLVAVLADLEGWHAGRGEREAAFEARLERERRLADSFTGQSDRETISRDLEDRLPAMASLPWFAMGESQLAELLEQGNRPDRLARAREAAQKGRRAFPDSPGGRRCLAIVERIEAPAYQLTTMKSDGPDRRSILVRHKNVARLSFRAYAIDLPSRVASEKDLRNILPQGQELERVLSGRPSAEWSAVLPATPDYLDHQTFVVPPMRTKGYYVVAASGDPDFSAGRGFPVVAAGFLLSDLVLVETAAAPGAGGRQKIEVLALSGETGRPLDGVAITVLKGRWNPTSTERIGEAVTDRDGRAALDFPAERGWAERFVFARRGADLAVGSGTPYGWRAGTGGGPTTASLVFTDRSVYRPLQKILWKVLAYQGDARSGRFRAFPRSPLTVTLYDQNGQSVEGRSVTTNDFGTAAGEFAIPAGRALGAWRVSTSLDGGGGATVRVEEYKRPTFEVTLKLSTEALRLNRPARVTGEARYYFGLPVSSGTVRWNVTRTPSFPWWFWWRGFHPEVRTETIAAGSSALQADGSFTIAFTPKADERLAGQSATTYQYAVSADASDEGGETRSATRTFRLGFVAVEARIDLPGGFLRAGGRSEVTVVRTNLDGAPRPGQGGWRLFRLEQPSEAPLPADLPPDPTETAKGGLRTPGDALRPRWQTGYAAEQVMAQWKNGVEVAQGDLTHDAKGIARIAVANLPAGAYRLVYRTRDEFGAEYEAPREIVVAAGSTPLALPAVLLVEAPSVPVGGTARLLAASGLPGQNLYFEIDRDGTAVERRTLVAGKSAAVIEIPIEERHRGGFAVKLTMVRDHQLVTQTQTVFVPWDDKELKVSFATFRDKLRPGQAETWTVKVEAPGGAPVEAAAAELLASMYDRSLDAFAPYSPPNPLSLYPSHTGVWPSNSNLGESYFGHVRGNFPELPAYPPLRPDTLKFPGGYAFGGPGRRGMMAMAKASAVGRRRRTGLRAGRRG